MQPKAAEPPIPQLAKIPTRIPGFDEVLLGGIPAGRRLICGAADFGKTRLGMIFLVNGATHRGAKTCTTRARAHHPPSARHDPRASASRGAHAREGTR
jgi:hypothetical protein